jgi:phosphoglycerol transferase MdoB-like AlkP superfamily enzyme
MNLLGKLFPSRIWTQATLIMGSCLLFKFLYFDLLWCMHTSFRSLSDVDTYLNAAVASLLLLFPYFCFRAGKWQTVILLLLDFLLIANLMYSRTYFEAIPLSNYAAVGNLRDFGASVWDSVRPADGVFILSTIVAAVLISRKRERRTGVRTAGTGERLRFYLSYLLVGVLCSYALTLPKGGFKQRYAGLQDAYTHTSTTPMFTVFGSLLYNVLQSQEVYTPKMEANFKEQLRRAPEYRPLPDSIGVRKNLIILLCESLESWVLEQTVDGQELTPSLNKLLKEKGTLYAPHVLTQVKGGRSIDAQLMIDAGMLPITDGAYSIKYPYNHFYSLPKAMKAVHGGRSYLLTADKETTWNQSIAANMFGIDTLLSRPDWKDVGEKFGTHPQLGDVPFFKQVCEKMENKEIGRDGENIFLTCVTYSGHAPFKLPEELRRVHFGKEYPERMCDYMATANYTDRAIGLFVDYLRSRPDYQETMIVITGDHEGLADHRAPLCATAQGKGVVSAKPFVPFIVLNSPVALRYEPVMGQIDIYPTLLNLLHLDNYTWKGMGESIFNTDKPPFAIGSYGNIEGDTTHVAAQKMQYKKEAYRLSDQLIRFDYFGRKENKQGDD